MTEHVTRIDAIEAPPVKEPVARRKGPAGAWQVLHRGKWVSERAVKSSACRHRPRASAR